MKQAIKELKNYKINLDNIVNSYTQSDETKIQENVLFYKSISEGLFYLSHYKNGVDLKLTNNFDTFGTMIDVSRGAVFKVDYIKSLIRKQSLMGVNEIWLYMEDMYELKKYPIFGYMRRAYSEKELKEVVEYGEIFGVKIVPAIQTLGHMDQLLRWNKMSHVKDQKNVLLTNNESTYALINEMFKTLKNIFKHDKIHVGLDETWGFGFGNHYKTNGYIPQMELFFNHLDKVNKIAVDNGFKDVLMWSDMPYRLLSKNDYYYDYNIIMDQKIVDRIPENVRLVYWDYYNYDFNRVDKMLANHNMISEKNVFASGTWIWTRFTYDKIQTDKTASIHIEASIKNNVREFILTQWMDDGAYGDHETTLLGVYEQSIKANTANDVSDKTYQMITSENIDVSYNRTKLHSLEMSPVGLMWDDHQFSIYLANFVKNDLKNYEKHFIEMENLLKIYENNELYQYEYNIISSNYNKIKGRYSMIESYQKNEKINSSKYFTRQIESLEQLNSIISEKWNKNYHANGLEIIQSRIGTQIIRAKEMIKIEKQFNSNEINQIEGIMDKVEVFDEGLSLKHADIAFTTIAI